MTVTVTNANISNNGGSALGTHGEWNASVTMTIDDSTLSANGGSGISLRGTYVRIRDSLVSDNTGDGIWGSFCDPRYLQPRTFINADNSVIADNGGNGISACMLELRNSTVTNNLGYGIQSEIDYYGGGSLAIDASTIAGNQHGGVFSDFRFWNPGDLYFFQISNSTISGNHSRGDGAGIAIDTGGRFPPPADVLLISNSTVTGNTAAGVGGGIALLGYYYNSYRDLIGRGATLTNSIVAGNRASADPDLSTLSLSLATDYSLIQDPGNALLTEAIPGSNLFGLDPLLGPLADNGGPTQTHGLLPGSPALDRGDPDFAPPPVYDQRGEPFGRVVDGRIDLGAVEAQAGEVPSAHAWLYALGDTNADGTPEIAVISEGDGTSQATVKDAATGALISRFDFSAALWPVTGSATLPADGAGVGPRLVLLGAAPARAETRQALTGDLFGAVTFNPHAYPVDLAVLPDQDGNSVQDLATLVTASTTSIAADAVTERVSLDSHAAQSNSWSWDTAISADGRFVAFSSQASNLVPDDTNASADVFVRDRATGTTERVSLDSNGTEGDDRSGSPAISADGRLVAFSSAAGNLVPGDTNSSYDIFVHDRATGTTERVSVHSNGTQGNGTSYSRPAISADGRFVAFTSQASNLAPGDTNGRADVFVHDRNTGETTRVSLGANGAQGDSHSYAPELSTDGRFVAFYSYAGNLVPGDTNGETDVFVHDRQTGMTERVSLHSNGTQGNSDSFSPAISADGRFVAFASDAGNLTQGDENRKRDVFIRDRTAGTTKQVSVDACASQATADSWGPAISADGTVVAFQSEAKNLVADDTNSQRDIFVRAPNSTDTPVLCPVAADLTSVEIRDAATGTLFNTLSFAPQLDPRQVLALPDLNGNGSAEVGVSLLSTVGKADRVVIKDTATGALVQTLWSGVGLIQAAVAPDRNGNGAPEVALLWRNPAAGTTQVWVTDAATGQRLAAVAGIKQDVVPLTLAVVADITGNGIEEYAVLGSTPTTGQVSATLLDGAAGRWLNRIWYSKECTPLDLVSIADVNGNGAPELVMLGRCGPDGQLRAVINDTKSGQVLRRLDF